jgi:hypothetical protein
MLRKGHDLQAATKCWDKKGVLNRASGNSDLVSLQSTRLALWIFLPESVYHVFATHHAAELIIITGHIFRNVSRQRLCSSMGRIQMLPYNRNDAVVL